MVIASSTFVENPLVSVLVFTYNQKDTIAQTINSILDQECNFAFEIVIGDDCSTDGTLQICLNYQKKYPNIIKILAQQYNKGVVKNYSETIYLCKGDFIAQCAGDDYWCDQKKLEKQMTFLENNAGYGFVRTGCYTLDVVSNKLSTSDALSKNDGDVSDVAFYGIVGAGPTVFFKRELLMHINFEEFIARKFSIEDYPMQAIMSKYTKFGYIPDITAVYRVSNGSASHPTDRIKILKYYAGFAAAKRYLSELYPMDITFTESMENDYVSSKELKLAYDFFDYKSAKKSAFNICFPTKKDLLLVHMTKNFFLFLIFASLKNIIRIMRP